MGQSKKQIELSEIFEWLASTGFTFPSNIRELARFEILYRDFEYKLNAECIDPYAIITGAYKPKKLVIKFDEDIEYFDNIKMAARNLNSIPDHILKKLKQNQNGLGSEEKGNSDKGR